jgi:hypothetical protein
MGAVTTGATRARIVTTVEWQHGTMNGYGNNGCRCQPCRDANAAAQRARREKWREAGFEGRKHGTYYLYSMGCRCDACKQAAAAWSAKKRGTQRT